jgi:hypothetical protein
MLDAIGIVRILNAHTHPDIVVPRKVSSKFNESLGSLGQNLKRVPLRFSHHIKNTAYEFERNVIVKKIAHRINKDFSWLIPPQRLVKYVWL